MKEIFAALIVLVFTFGIAGISFSEETGALTPKHDDMKICANMTDQGGGRDVSIRNSGASEEWNLTFYESLRRNGIELPSDQLARAGSQPCVKDEAGG
jgi:hypothetical protein